MVNCVRHGLEARLARNALRLVDVSHGLGGGLFPLSVESVIAFLLASTIIAPLTGCLDLSTLTGPLVWRAPKGVHVVTAGAMSPGDACSPTIEESHTYLIAGETDTEQTWMFTREAFTTPCAHLQLDFEIPEQPDSLQALLLVNPCVPLCVSCVMPERVPSVPEPATLLLVGMGLLLSRRLR